MKYCEAIYKTVRWKTREVKVGRVGIGGDHPIRIQSMTTSNTRDVSATVDQILKLEDTGCEIVRLTVQGKKEAESCELIKNELIRKQCSIPLVADIHFYPPAALFVAEFVDKIRINPGNFADKRAVFQQIEYDDVSYQAELERLEEIFSPLVQKCKKLHRAIRIGTNHGSLSDRILNRYGDNPQGMVESALEFARVARKLDFHDLVFSMKASRPFVMIQAYRQLVAEMIRLGWNYPLHLGVTEAGLGDAGRIKSAIGIGSLLLDGLGDTLRVSLTEDPWAEIKPCSQLIELVKNKEGKGIPFFVEKKRPFDQLERRLIHHPAQLHKDGTVCLKITEEDLLKEDFFHSIGFEEKAGDLEKTNQSVDLIWMDQLPQSKEGSEKLSRLKGIQVPVFEAKDLFFVSSDPSKWDQIEKASTPFVLFHPQKSPLHETRRFVDWMKQKNITIPLILQLDFQGPQGQVLMEAGMECGSLLSDRLIEGISLSAPHSLLFLRELSFSLMQYTHLRTIKTEFISCPGCGRTLFDLQSTTEKIQKKTAHLPGVKIAIMGCIVNGPGEMADADFGYVGSKSGKVDLYLGKKCVAKDIPFQEGDQKLIELIQKEGRWIDPPSDQL